MEKLNFLAIAFISLLLVSSCSEEKFLLLNLPELKIRVAEAHLM